MDGFWDETGAAGIGLVVVSRGTITARQGYQVQAINSVQAEATAICKGLQLVAGQLGEGGRVYSDSLKLVNVLAQGLPVVPDLRVSQEL